MLFILNKNSTFVANNQQMIRETRIVSIHNTPMVIFDSPECISDDIVKYNDFWEFELFNAWQWYFPTQGLMLDIGANIGGHCVQFKHYFPDLEIWAFELHHDNYRVLAQNIKRYPDVKAFNVGVGSRTSVITYNDGHHSNSGVVKVVPGGNNYNIVLALDDLDIPPVSFIKIDIEGFELSAFEGMTKLIERDYPLIWLEDITANNQAVAYLISLGYDIIALNKETSDFLMHKK